MDTSSVPAKGTPNGVKWSGTAQDLNLSSLTKREERFFIACKEDIIMKHVEAYKKGYYLPPVVDMSWAMADAPKKPLFGAAWTCATATRPS